MASKQSLHQAYLDKWTRLIKEQQASGLTIETWCKQNNLSKHKYNYWKHLLKEQFIDSIPQEIVPLTTNHVTPAIDCSHNAIHFISPIASTSNNPSFIRLTVADATFEIPTSFFSPEIVSGIIKAVHYA